MLPWRSMVLGDVMAGIRRLRKEQVGQKEGADKVLPLVGLRLPDWSFEPFSEFGEASCQEILMFFLPLLVQKPDFWKESWLLHTFVLYRFFHWQRYYLQDGMPYAKYSKLSGEWFWTYRSFFQVDCFRQASRTSQDRAHPAQDSHSSMGQCGVVRLVAGAGGFRTRITVQLPKNERRRFDPEDWNASMRLL